MTISFIAVAHTNFSGAGSEANGGTSASCDTSGANFLVANVVDYQVNAACTFSDSKTNTWSAKTSYSVAGNARNVIKYVANPTVGSGHTFTSSGTNTYGECFVLGFSGVHASPSDQENGVGGSSGTSLATGSITPSQDNCLVIAGIGVGSAAGSPSINGGFTATEVAAGVSGHTFMGGVAYLIQTTAAAANPTWSWSGAATPTANIASFKAAAAAVGGIFIRPNRVFISLLLR